MTPRGDWPEYLSNGMQPLLAAAVKLKIDNVFERTADACCTRRCLSALACVRMCWFGQTCHGSGSGDHCVAAPFVSGEGQWNVERVPVGLCVPAVVCLKLVSCSFGVNGQ